VPWRARDVRPLLLRRWAGRPQLKRDPLGAHMYRSSPRDVLTVVLALALTVAGAVWLLQRAIQPLCGSILIAEFPAPSKPLKASLYVSDCGATTDVRRKCPSSTALSGLYQCQEALWSLTPIMVEHREALAVGRRYESPGPRTRYWSSRTTGALEYLAPQRKCGASQLSMEPWTSGAPNMRLKLAGLSFLRESEWLCPGGHGLSSTSLAPARSSPAA
jgi:hypothetical protein